jgi:hypothetical protein
LLAWHTWTVFYQTNGSLPAARGPFSFVRTFFCHVRTSVLARGPFTFIRTPIGLFCSFALRMLTILSASRPFSIACVARVESVLSNVRTSARRARTFFVHADLLSVMGGPLPLAREPFLFIRTPSGLFCSLELGARAIFCHARFARERFSSFFTCARGPFASPRGRTARFTRRRALTFFFLKGRRPLPPPSPHRPSLG